VSPAEITGSRRYRRSVGRPLRDERPDGFYHVVSRGNNRGSVFVDDGDHLLFLDLLRRYAERHDWSVLAYCLMTTHYHLVMEIGRGGLSAGMCLLNGDFSRKANKRHGRIGHVFNNRFSASAIDRESHLLEACRYVVLNPVRAGICQRPESWRWSSYRASAGFEFAPSVLAEAELLTLFDRDANQARHAYRAFVSEGRTPVPGTGVPPRASARP
jgi:REP element-mobilizing transposase RayT